MNETLHRDDTVTAVHSPRVVVTTAANAGAVAMVQLHGDGAAAVLCALTGVTDWPVGRLRLASFDGIDSGLAVVFEGGATGPWVQLSPHGGVRVVQRLVDRLVELGAVHEGQPDARALYREAESALEADMLATIARAASPAAVDLLAAQPALWREVAESDALCDEATRRAIVERSAQLDRLVSPATVVLLGRPNVGKSTLTNRMMGRAASLVADLPGTTRDWVAGLVELTPKQGGTSTAVAVRWFDTPGVRASDDAIEQEAITLAQQVVRSADLVLAMRDGEHDWPVLDAIGRQPDVWLMNKVDDASAAGVDAGASREKPLAISAMTGAGIDALQQRIIASLGLASIEKPERWAFSPTLREVCRSGDVATLKRYVGA